jgi:hypothetical protein
VGLYYQTLDSEESGRWSVARGGWEVLDDQFNWSIRKAISVARQQSVPELLQLPLELTGGSL